MHHANNAVIMQTKQLGRIKALEEELCSSRVKMTELEQKITEQDWVITQLVGDNLDHLQDNMRLTADQLPISAVLGSLPISHFAYSAPCFRYPRSVHYQRSTTRLSQPSSY